MVYTFLPAIMLIKCVLSSLIKGIANILICNLCFLSAYDVY